MHNVHILIPTAQVIQKEGDRSAYLSRCREIQHVGQEISQSECEGEKDKDRKVAITRKETSYGNGYISVKVRTNCN